MTAINFPDSPSVNDVFTSGTRQWVWDGTSWITPTSFNGGNALAIIQVAASDEVTPVSTGAAKVTFRMPHAMTLTAVRASLTTASSSGLPTVDIKQNGTSILSTKITIDVSELTSTTAATPPVISTSALTDDAQMTIDINNAGTGAVGLKVALIGTIP